MRKLILSLILLSASFAFAQSAKDWEAEYKKVASYDAKWVGRLKNDDGTWRRPKPEVVALLKKLKPQIEDAARALGVDQRAIAGSILSENSLNVGVSDGAIDLLMKMGLSKSGKIGGHQFTVGLGQLNPSVARSAENYVAKLQNRKPLSDDEINTALQDPAGSVLLVAQVLKQTQDIYKTYGFDISGDPAILSTLYNLGQPEDRAKSAKAAQRLPRENYFGLFVDRYTPLIEQAVGKPVSSLQIAQPKITQSTSSAAGKISVASGTKKPASEKSRPSISKNQKVTSEIGTSTNPSTARVTSYKVLPAVKLVKATVLSKSLSLSQGPPSCPHAGYGSGDEIEKKYEKYRNFASVGIAEAGQSWTLLAPALDCDANKWSLIRTSGGATGWVKTDDLDLATTQKFTAPTTCSSSDSKECRLKTEKAIGKQIAVDADVGDKSALTYLTPITGEGVTPNFKHQDFECGYKKINEDISSNPMKPHRDIQEYDSKQEKNASSSLKKLSQQTQAALKKMGDRSSPSNPYNGTVSGQSRAYIESVDRCISSQLARKYPCNIDVKKMQDLLSDLNLPKKPSLEQIQKLKDQTSKIKQELAKVSQQYRNDTVAWAASEEEIASVSQAGSIRELEQCSLLLKDRGIDVDSLQKRIETLSKVSESDWKTTDASRYAAANLIKACAANLDLFWSQKLNNTGEIAPSLCNAKHGDVVSIGYMNMMKKEIARKLLSKTDIEGAIKSDFDKVMSFYSVPAVIPGFKMDLHEESYCPNRTAEFIENLLETNPCVSHIYVPDPWLVSRLNALGSKVLFRPFEKDSVYAIDYSEVKCK